MMRASGLRGAPPWMASRIAPHTCTALRFVQCRCRVHGHPMSLLPTLSHQCRSAPLLSPVRPIQAFIFMRFCSFCPTCALSLFGWFFSVNLRVLLLFAVNLFLKPLCLFVSFRG